jgi:trk system potassium uptake protein TrkA
VKQVAVIGLGRFGLSVVQNLAALGVEVLAIDLDEKNVSKASAYANYAVQADATDDATIKSLGLRNFDFVVVAIGTDIQASVIITLNLKEMGVKKVVAKAQNDIHGKILNKAGADKVIFPERDMGARLANNIVSSNVLDYIELSKDFSIVEIETPSSMKGKNLKDLDLREKYGVNVIAVKRQGKIIVSPKADDYIEADDVLVVIGKNPDIRRLSAS